MNVLNKRLTETTIKAHLVRREATVVIPFCNLCVLCVSAVHLSLVPATPHPQRITYCAILQSQISLCALCGFILSLFSLKQLYLKVLFKILLQCFGDT